MTRTPDETPFFFDGGNCALFGVLHRPVPGVEARPAFVFCHPLGEEKLWSHRVFVSYARRLAAAGHPVLRFDFMGNGDSEGSFCDLSLSRFCADLRRAIEEARRLTGTTAVSLLGLRLGATIASLVAEEDKHIRHLVLWAPVTDGERYLQELLRINVMTQMAIYKVVRQERPELVAEMQQGRTVNVDGYEMGWPLYASVASITGEPSPRVYNGPCLVVQVDKQPRPAADLQRLVASYSGASLKFAQEEAFWKEIAKFYQEAPNLFSVTSEWLGAHQPMLHVIPTNEPAQSTKSTRLPSRPAGVRVVTSFEETDLDEHGWNSLASRATNSVFQTHQWHRSWWSTYRTTYEPLLVVVSNAGSTCGVAPLMVEQTSARGRVVRFIGEGRADYCDLLAANNWNTVAAMVRGLKDYGAWDILDLSNIPSESRTVAMLKAICQHEGLRVTVHDHFVCPTLMVRGHERAALKVLNKPSLRRRQNYFERIGCLTFRDLTATKDVEPHLDAFFTQHVARWGTTNSPSLFQDPANRSFYRELTARLDGTMWLLFSLVELDGRPIALHYGFDYNDTVIWYKPSFDPAFASGSPGLVLVRHLIHRVVDQKRRELDFTIGDEPFKRRFTNVLRKTVNVQVYRDPARYAFERSRRGFMAAIRRVRNRR